MKFIIGKKLEMSQIFKADGNVIPVTAVLATPNVVTQVKSAAGKDGYDAVQVGFGLEKKLKKSLAGHLKGLAPAKTIKEFRVESAQAAGLKRGDQITVEAFAEGDAVKVSGVSKGKGFQGVVKRHGFHGSPKTHGHKDQLRMPGSIGAGGVQRVFKGRRMAGHMGDENVTVSGLNVVAIDAEKNIIYIKGAIPGARNSVVTIYGPGVMEIKQAEEPKVQIEAVAEAEAEEIQAEPAKAEAPAAEAEVAAADAGAAEEQVETPAETAETEVKEEVKE